MSNPIVSGEILSGSDYLGKETIYKLKVVCPYCGKEHIHGLGNDPEEQNGTDRLADCFGGEYTLSIIVKK